VVSFVVVLVVVKLYANDRQLGAFPFPLPTLLFATMTMSLVFSPSWHWHTHTAHQQRGEQQ